MAAQLKRPTKWLCPAPPWPEQTLGKSCQHVFLTKIIEPFCRAPTPPVRQPSAKLKSSRNSNTISILLPYKQIDQRKGVTFAIGCIAKLYNTTQIKDNQSLQNGGSKSCYDVVCHFVDPFFYKMGRHNPFFYKIAFPISTKWGGTTLALPRILPTKWLWGK